MCTLTVLAELVGEAFTLALLTEAVVVEVVADRIAGDEELVSEVDDSDVL